MTLGVLILVSLATHRSADDLWFSDDEISDIIEAEGALTNQGGVVGAGVAFVLLNLSGFWSLFVPLWLCGKGWSLVSHRKMSTYLRTIWLLFLSVFLMGVLFGIPAAGRGEPLFDPASTLGGFIAHWAARGLVTLFGTVGSIIVALGFLTMLMAMLVAWRPKNFPGGQKWAEWMSSLGSYLSELGNPFSGSTEEREPLRKRSGASMKTRLTHFMQGLGVLLGTRDVDEDMRAEVEASPPRRKLHIVQPPAQQELYDEAPEHEEEQLLPSIVPPAPTNRVAAQSTPDSSGDFEFPPIHLLAEAPPQKSFASQTELDETTDALRRTLEIFGIGVNGDITAYPGPVITRFEFKPSAGIKVNQVLALSDDLALALSAKRIRIIAPIPGKPAIGIEIPNRKPQIVYLSEIISSAEYADSKWHLPFALGKTTSGVPVVTDLTRMPHLLIAGATGSGKSVCINAIITSLLYRLPPDRLRFLFIDPKRLELPVYDGIPHLERPVVIKSKQAEKLLIGAVGEMEERYGILAKAGVRSIEAYNDKMPDHPLPYIVIVVDELADLMMSAESNRIETTIARLAQMARAVGIHLILATQRPSVDVITGVIKANFSSRIAFQVASKIDSRTIIDANGAEKLLGKGDMLFSATGEPEAVRLHGAFVSNDETIAIVRHLRGQSGQTEAIEAFAVSSSDDDAGVPAALEGVSDDSLIREAAEVVIKSKMGSVSLLQRRLGIGYQRAGRLIDQLERAGVVGPHDGSRAREVLVDMSFLETHVAPHTPSSV